MMSLPRFQDMCRGRWSGALLALLLVTLGGCAAAPEVRFHSLLPTETPLPRPAAGQPLPAPRLVVAPVRIPSALDQPQWLVRRADASLQLLEQDRWASPLADELRAALREGLSTRHGVTDGNLPLVPRAGDRPGLPEAPAWRLLVEVLRLEAWPGQYSQLDVQWALQPPRAGAQAAQCRFMVREPVSGPGTQALAEAHRLALQRLADDIGRQLTVMLAGGSAACSGPPTS